MPGLRYRFKKRWADDILTCVPPLFKQQLQLEQRQGAGTPDAEV